MEELEDTHPVQGPRTCHEESRHALGAVPHSGLHQCGESPLVPALQVQARIVGEQKTHQLHVT